MGEIKLLDFLNAYSDNEEVEVIVFDENTKELARNSMFNFEKELLEQRYVYHFWIESGNLCLLTSNGK